MALNDEIKALVKWALDEFNRADGDGNGVLASYALWGRYYRGRQPLNINMERWRKTFGADIEPPSENLCGVCVDVQADLLKIEGFDGANKDSDTIGAQTQEIWRRNRMQEWAGQIHKSNLIYSESFVVVWPEDEVSSEPVIYPNKPLNVVVKYDPEKLGYIIQGAKTWVEDGYTRLTIYTLDRIIRLRTRKKITEGTQLNANSFDLYDDDKVKPETANPYEKVPIFRFVNGAAAGDTGLSEIEALRPPQDSLNRALVNTSVTGEFIAYPQKYAIGYDILKDPETGAPINPFISGPNNIWINENKEGSFGQFAQGSLADYVIEQNNHRMAIARISGVPPHYLNMDTGGWPSGESLKTASSRLTEKTKNRMESFGNTWEDIMRFCLEIKGIKDVEIEIKWTDPTPRLSELESWQAAQAELSAGGSAEKVLKDRGYSEQDLEEAKAQNDMGAIPAFGAVTE
jgi:hypothetical protein